MDDAVRSATAASMSKTATLAPLRRSGGRSRFRWRLVERVRAAGDGRLRHVRLTPEGDRVWSGMLASIRRYYDDALAGFSTEECLLLFRLLDRLRDGLGRIAGPEGD